MTYAFRFTAAAQRQLHAIDRPVAMRVKKLAGPSSLTGFVRYEERRSI